ncbi:MAG: energy transducer TonB [Bacteroidales bacterium]
MKAQQEAIIKIDKQQAKSDIFVNVEQKPEFPGKKEGLIEFYKKTTLYSICDKKESNCQTLYYQVVVDTLGNVGNFKIIKGINPKLDAETKRIVESMPKWKPGMQKGQPVRVLVTLDIKYKSE